MSSLYYFHPKYARENLRLQKIPEEAVAGREK
jgi:hypothetical protein